MSFRDLLGCYRFSFFRESVCEIGIILTLICYFFCSFLLLLISPFIFLVFPFVYLNERSKSWFTDSSKGDENAM